MPSQMPLYCGRKRDCVSFANSSCLCGRPDDLEHVVEDIPRLSLAGAAVLDLESLHEAQRHGLAVFLQRSSVPLRHRQIASMYVHAYLKLSCNKDHDAIVGARLHVDVRLFDLVHELLGELEVLYSQHHPTARLISGC